MDTTLPEAVRIMRVAAVIRPDLPVGEAANVAAIVVAGLQCDAFEKPVEDGTGCLHAAVLWNVVVLKAKSASQIVQMIEDARSVQISTVAFARIGQTLSNNYPGYREALSQRSTADHEILALGLYGTDEAVRKLTRKCRLYN